MKCTAFAWHNTTRVRAFFYYFIDLHGQIVVGQIHIDDDAATRFHCLFQAHLGTWPGRTRSQITKPGVPVLEVSQLK